MRTRIIVDSTADVPAHIRERLLVVPLTILFGDEAFIDGVTMDHNQFYEKLTTSDVLPTTSQPSPDTFEQVYQSVTDAGDEAVVLTISGKLSGTYQSAVIAAEDYPEICVVDSTTVAIGAGILAQRALELAREGCNAETIYRRLKEERKNIRIVAMLDTLEYLKRGGRISKTVAFAGGLLNIKPVICIEDGEIKMLGKARGSRQGNNLLVQEIEKAGGVDFRKPLMLGYTGLSDNLLQKYIADSAHLWQGNVEQLNISVVGSVVGTHAGPGAVAVAFFSAEK